MNAPPRLGQRVRFTRDDHPIVSPGRGGMIEQLGPDGQFFVQTDCGGFFGWTSFTSWEPTDEPDVPLDPEYVARRTQTQAELEALAKDDAS